MQQQATLSEWMAVNANRGMEKRQSRRLGVTKAEDGTTGWRSSPKPGIRQPWRIRRPDQSRPETTRPTSGDQSVAPPRRTRWPTRSTPSRSGQEWAGQGLTTSPFGNTLAHLGQPIACTSRLGWPSICSYYRRQNVFLTRRLSDGTDERRGTFKLHPLIGKHGQ